MRIGHFSVFVEGGNERASDHVEIPHGSQYSIRVGNHDSGRRCDAELTIDGELTGVFRLAPGQVFSIDGPTEGDRGRFTAFGAHTEEGQQSGSGNIARRDRGLIVVRFKPEYRLEPPKGVLYRDMRYRDMRDLNDDSGRDSDLDSSKGTGDVLRSGPEATFSTSPEDRGRPGFLCSAPRPRSVRTCGIGGQSQSAASQSAAVTGLTGRNDQKWQEAGPIDHDPSREVVISLRLVATEVASRDAVRPLKGAACRTGGCGCRPKGNPTPAPVE